jgi:sulfoxide reductase catalytic subunit YedY
MDFEEVSMSKQSDLKSVPVRSSEITPEHVFLNRREFMKVAGVTGAALAVAACGAAPTPRSAPPSDIKVSKNTDELGSSVNTYQEITNYNNYYEFSINKESVASMSEKFKTSPWEVSVSGLVNNPKTFGLEDLLKKFTQEERIYRLRCVEAWSMVIPWTGFKLSDLLKEVDPKSSGRYVRFETVLRPVEMPGQKVSSYPWPYQEGLRLDEAMNDLVILATGLYGKPLPAQNGGPIRLVVPWKYGFKSIKGIVKIELVPDEPETLWSTIASDEYGFYANVNPKVSHPRWSQGSERRIGELKRRETLMFNGYGEQVAHLYKDMDLKTFY